MTESRSTRHYRGANFCGKFLAPGLPYLSPTLSGRRIHPSLPPTQNSVAGQFTLSPEDDEFLQELESASFQFFWEQQNPKTGMVQDRCDLRGGTPGVVASIAATGFGLTALCIGEKRGFVTRVRG